MFSSVKTAAVQVAELAKDNKKFAAIDKAIGKDSFKVRISVDFRTPRISCIVSESYP